MKLKRYVLDGHEVKPCDDYVLWATCLGETNRRVAGDLVGDVRVSTVFLGVDHQFGNGPPLLFETMVFGGSNDQDQIRYSTWEEAEKGHAEIVERERAVK